MKKQLLTTAMMLVGLITSLSYLSAQSISQAKKILGQEFNLIPQHSKDTQYFEMESRLINYGADGTRLGTDVYHLFLRCVPGSGTEKGDEYTCLKFTVQINNAPEVIIPSLTNWTYNFLLTPSAKDDKGQVLGIDHAKFENLADEKGILLPMGNAYHVYNAFIDFHSMNIFCEKAEGGKGIQDLKQIGDKIVHAASFSQPPVDLGGTVAHGSYFKNGEVTLLFKGLGLVNEKTCGLLEYDSGQSSFCMVMKPMANMEVTTKGSSHYWGDIYKDLATGWIQKATLHELVVSETAVPGMNRINAVIERNIDIKNVKRLTF